VFCWIAAPAGAVAGELRIGLPLPADSREWKIASGLLEDLDPPAPGTLTVHLLSHREIGSDTETEIRSGALDGGLVADRDFDSFGLGPDAWAYAVPFTFASLEEVDRVRARLDGPILRRIGGEAFEALAFLELGLTYALSTRELDDPDSWPALKIWTPAERGAARILKASLSILGLEAVALPGKAVRNGLQEGVVDTVIAPPAVAVFKRWHRDIDTVLDMPFSYAYGILVVRADSMGRLSPAEQEAVRRAFARLGRQFTVAARDRGQYAWNVLRRWEKRIVKPNGAMLDRSSVWAARLRRELDAAHRPSPETEADIGKLLQR
jgi:TRAP-type C4-dicarboxylate transport system substrate-binding protein